MLSDSDPTMIRHYQTLIRHYQTLIRHYQTLIRHYQTLIRHCQILIRHCQSMLDTTPLLDTAKHCTVHYQMLIRDASNATSSNAASSNAASSNAAGRGDTGKGTRGVSSLRSRGTSLASGGPAVGQGWAFLGKTHAKKVKGQTPREKKGHDPSFPTSFRAMLDIVLDVLRHTGTTYGGTITLLRGESDLNHNHCPVTVYVTTVSRLALRHPLTREQLSYLESSPVRQSSVFSLERP